MNKDIDFFCTKCTCTSSELRKYYCQEPGFIQHSEVYYAIKLITDVEHVNAKCIT